MTKPTIAELEHILAGGDGPQQIEILPNGEIRAVSAWQLIETCPPQRTVLLAAKPETHLWWKFGVGIYCEPLGKPMLFDWDWAFPPTHWRMIDAPDGGRTSLYPIPEQPE